MTKKAKIKVLVDTVKLKSDYPKGGHIDVQDYITMSDDQKDSYYKDGIKDKLVTVVNPDTNLEWTIDANNKKDKLVFLKCDVSKELINMLLEQPEPEDVKSKNKWKAKLKKDIPTKESGFYTYEFAFKGEEEIKWSWDPAVETKPPPPGP